MSGECEKCGERCLDCKCGIGCDAPGTKVKIKRLGLELIPLENCLDPPAQQIQTKWVNVKGREEHEAVMLDAAKCKELGLDQVYEVMAYLNRWGNWLINESA